MAGRRGDLKSFNTSGAEIPTWSGRSLHPEWVYGTFGRPDAHVPSPLESALEKPVKKTHLSTFRMNTSKSVSKQRTLSTFRMNTGSVDILGTIAMREIDKEALVVFSDEAGGTMAEVGLLPFARVALQVATQVLPPYRTRFSKHQFTQPQLLAVLCLMRFEHWTFREAETRLREDQEVV